MKKLEIIIKPEKLELVKKAFDELGVSGLMLTNIMGYGNQRGYVQVYRGSEVNIDLLPKIKVETVVHDDICETVIDAILKTVSTKTVGDGKIFVYNVEDAVRIRTGERCNDAI